MVEEKKTQLPKDIIDGIKKLSEVTSTPVQSLLERLKEIKNTDENIQTMEHEDFKIRFAWAILYREFAVRGNAEDFYVMPLLTPSPREVKTKKGEMMYIGELTALVQKLTKDENGTLVPGDVTYASGTFFRDGAKNLLKVEKNKVYRTSLIGKQNSWGMEISSDRASFASVDYKFPTTFEKFFTEEIQPKNIEISLGEMDLNKGDTTTDIRLSTVTAFDAEVGEREGREYGYYDFMDHSVIGSNYRMFFHPKDIEFLQGSILKVGYRIAEDEKTKELRITPHFVLPTDIAEKRELTSKAVSKKKQETVDISLDEEAGEEKSEGEVDFAV